MTFWQNAAKKHAKQGTAEYTHEHYHADCDGTHWPLLILTTFQSLAGSIIPPAICSSALNYSVASLTRVAAWCQLFYSSALGEVTAQGRMSSRVNSLKAFTLASAEWFFRRKHPKQA